MKKNKNKLTIGGTLLIALLFVMSFIWPSTQMIAKIGALLIFAFICLSQLYARKRNGENVDKELLFNVAIVLVIAYIFFY